MQRVVVIIDSDTAVSSQIEQTFAAHGFATHVLGEADPLEFVRTHAPSIILMNVEMARGSGYSFCNRFKTQQDLRTIPVILTSTEAGPAFEQHEKTAKTPADAYLKKPYNMAQLLAVAGGLLPEGMLSGPPAATEAAPLGNASSAGSEGEDLLSELGDALDAALGDSPAAPGPQEAPPAPPPFAEPPPSGAGAPPPLPPHRPQRSLGPTLDEMLAQARGPEKAIAPPTGGPPEDKVIYLRELLNRRQTDLSHARDLWAQRERELTKIQDQLDNKERELERAKRAREDLLEQLTTNEDAIASLRVDGEMASERTERLERERQALSLELEETHDELENANRTLGNEIAQLTTRLAEEQEARQSENAEAESTQLELSKQLELTRMEFAEKAADFGRREAEAQANLAELSAQLSEERVVRETIEGKYKDLSAEAENLRGSLRTLGEEKATSDQKAQSVQETLRNRVAELEEDRDGLERELKQTQLDREEKRRRLAASEGRVADLEGDLEDAQSHASDVEMRLTAAQTRLDELSIELDDANTLGEDLGNAKARVEAALQKSQDETRDEQARHAALTTEFEAHKKSANKLARGLESSLGDVKDELAQRTQALADAGEREIRLQDHVQALEEKLDATQGALKKSQQAHAASVEKRDVKIEQLEREADRLKDEAHDVARGAKVQQAQLKAELDELRAHADGVESELSRSQAKVVELETQRTDMRQKLTDLTGKLRRSEAEGDRVSSELGAANERMGELSEQLAEVKSKANLFESEIDEIKSNYQHDNKEHAATLERTSSKARDRIEKLQTDKESLKTALADHKSRLSDAQDQIAEALGARNELQQSFDRIKQEQQALTDRVTSLDTQAQDASERAESLGDENVKVTGRLKRAMAERDALRRKLAELQETQQVGEQTMIKSFDDLKKSRIDDENRFQETIVQLQGERAQLREKYAELRRKAEAIKRRSDGLSAAANEQISQATEAQKALQEKLRAAMETHAQERGRAKAQVEQLQAQVAEAQTSGAADAENQLTNLKARLAQQEERVARLTTEIANERERRKKVIAKAREYEAQLAARGEDETSVADEWRTRFSAERKRSDGYKEKYQGLGQDYRDLLERHQSLVSKVKKARAAKEKAAS